MEYRKIGGRLLSLALAVLLALAACGSSDKPDKVYAEENFPQNDGQPAKLTIGPIDDRIWGRWVQGDDQRLREVLEEIIAKYRADFPNTEIEVLPQGASDGESDITVIDQGLGLPGDRWLLDLSQYKEAWAWSGRVCNAANTIMHYMGGEEIYAVPLKYGQLMMFYRADWFEAYNAEQTRWVDGVRLDDWDWFMRVSERLEKGGVLVAEDDLFMLFQSILWSYVGYKNLSDPAAACYASQKAGGGTIFGGQEAEKAAEVFQGVLDRRVDTANEDLLDAFINGEAAVLILGPTPEDYARLSQMPEGSWEASGLPNNPETGVTVAPMEWVAWAIRADTQEPEKAAHFLAYLTNLDNNTHMVREGVASPVYKEVTVLEPSLLDEPQSEEINLINTVYYYADLPRFFERVNPWYAFQTYAGQFAGGEISSKGMLAGLNQFFQDEMDNYREAGGIPPWERPKK